MTLRSLFANSAFSRIAGRYLWGCSILLMAVATASATVTEPITLEEAIGEAVFIGKAKLLKRTAVIYDNNGRMDICGFVYEVHPIEVMKGSKNSFNVYSEVASDVWGDSYEYLLLAFSSPRLDSSVATPESAAAPGSLRKDCKHLPAPYFIRTDQQTVLPFRRSDSNSSSNLVSNRYGVLTGSGLPFERVDTMPGYYTELVFPWADVRQRIISILGGPNAK